MTDGIIYNLVELSKIDSTIARIIAERKKLESDALKKKQEFIEFSKIVSEKQKKFEDKKKEYLKEEKYLKEERDKISTRRKELSTLNNYKVQQAAEKELDFAIRQIQMKEETLLTSVDEMDNLEKDSIAAVNSLKQLRADTEKFLKEAQEIMPSLDERQKRQTASRVELLPKINPTFISNYDKVRVKYPSDAVVALNSQNGCGACNINIGPQALQKLIKAESIEKCPGCGRILYISLEKANELQTP
jgi:predicted  nucleic acid-binding Zn-ribbon protein